MILTGEFTSNIHARSDYYQQFIPKNNKNLSNNVSHSKYEYEQAEP